MATLKELENDGLSGFDPEWDEYSGRAYRWRVKAGSRTWFIGDWFETSGSCEYFASLISRQDWRNAVSSRLREGDTSVKVEIVYKEHEDGKPVGRVSVLKGRTYPVELRRVRGGETKPTVQWTQAEQHENREKRPLPSKNDIFNAQIGKGVKWYLFVWEDEGWRYVASLTDEKHKDALVSYLRKQGREVATQERSREWD